MRLLDKLEGNESDDEEATFAKEMNRGREKETQETDGEGKNQKKKKTEKEKAKSHKWSIDEKKTKRV